MRLQVQPLASLSGLRIWGCRELWCRLQMWLGSHVVVAKAPIGPLAWEPPYAAGVAPEKAKRPKKKRIMKTFLSVGNPNPKGSESSSPEQGQKSRPLFGKSKFFATHRVSNFIKCCLKVMKLLKKYSIFIC